jgi:kinesin family member 2/24
MQYVPIDSHYLSTGSERFADLTQNDAERVKEAVEINKSLAALKECIVARLIASEEAQDGNSKKQPHVPWRSSQLTTVLQQALVSEEVKEGEERKRTVLVVACVSPSPANLESTFNTLKWVMPFQVGVKHNESDRFSHVSSWLSLMDQTRTRIPPPPTFPV